MRKLLPAFLVYNVDMVKKDPIFEFEIKKDANKNQDQAMTEAILLARSKGYNQVSLQTYTPKGYWFMAYDLIAC